MVEELNIQDTWRERNQGRNQYTYYSNRHQSWSRIDMVWMSMELNSEVNEVEIGTNLWADHNPMRISWKGQKKSTRLTLNRLILKDKKFRQMMEKQVGFFFKESKKEDTSLQNLWDTVKAYIRGVAISYMAKKNKRKKQ
uniref:Endonuclease/exonuclease/phosphatase domain-containing protein n=1 Tax=Micrurus lemniscatus lemniscatus TaxID=129467 RepID=A0A2D4IHN6_MICLE